MKKIKVLIVEDSLMFRQILVRNLITDPMLEVVAQASDPYEARDAILKYEPDVMTLDIELIAVLNILRCPVCRSFFRYRIVIIHAVL